MQLWPGPDYLLTSSDILENIKLPIFLHLTLSTSQMWAELDSIVLNFGEVTGEVVSPARQTDTNAQSLQ